MFIRYKSTNFEIYVPKQIGIFFKCYGGGGDDDYGKDGRSHMNGNEGFSCDFRFFRRIFSVWIST